LSLRDNPFVRKAGRVLAVTVVAGFGYLVYLYLTLPDVRPLRTSNPKTTAFIELRAREARRDGREPRRVQRWMPYGRISPHLKRAVIVAEDAAFWGHEGIDVNEIRKSLETDIARGEFTRGASTITQQLAKNLYLSPSRNPLRKLREFLIARRLEAELTKSRIFELYLNEIEWGDGIYGVEAASRAYFRIPASAIGPDQAAMLAGAIVNPRVLNPLQPNGRLRARQRLIRARMGNVTPPPVVAAVPERRASDAAELSGTLAAPEPVDEAPLEELQPSPEHPAVEPQPTEPVPAPPIPKPFPQP
jgi:monofunctional biosynthetic peptidoglycan transglycosylase